MDRRVTEQQEATASEPVLTYHEPLPALASAEEDRGGAEGDGPRG